MPGHDLKLEKVSPENFTEFFDLICELASFEHLDPPDEAGRERLKQHAFQPNPYYEAYIARLESKPVAYIIYFFSYSSFKAKPTLYLEDVFVKEELRGRGYGKQLLMFCVRKAYEKGCGRMEWSALNWNKNAIDFYERLGARPLSEWTYFRVPEETIAELAKKY